MPRRRLRLAVIGSIAAVVTVAAGCGGQKDVAPGGAFDFVSPGGEVDILYDPPGSRGAIGDLTGPDLLTDKPIHASDYTGKIMVINVWGSWCAPCRTETPELEKVFVATQSLGVQFIGIDVRDARQAAQDFVADRHVTYPSIFDPSMRSMIVLGSHYPTSVVPTTMALDRHHRVAAVFLRALLADDLTPLIQRLATEP
ncbi:MAG TPA: TlpA disulfide reductase family protein [Mycobacterium sp.]|nr:TlpA disulfide reductase family protein [Mycobacterium sp.]